MCNNKITMGCNNKVVLSFQDHYGLLGFNMLGLFCFVALRPKSTAIVMAIRSVYYV